MSKVTKLYRVVSRFMNGTTETSAPLTDIAECEMFMQINEEDLDKRNVHKADCPVSYIIRGYYVPTKD